MFTRRFLDGLSCMYKSPFMSSSEDETTWDVEDDERQAEISGDPPDWHAGPEEEDAEMQDTPRRGVAPLTMDNGGRRWLSLLISAWRKLHAATSTTPSSPRRVEPGGA